MLFWQMRERTPPHQLEACFHLRLAKLARTDAGERQWMEDRRVPVVLLATDRYNHHAKALMSKSTAQTHTLYLCYMCTRMQRQI